MARDGTEVITSYLKLGDCIYTNSIFIINIPVMNNDGIKYTFVTAGYTIAQGLLKFYSYLT